MARLRIFPAEFRLHTLRDPATGAPLGFAGAVTSRLDRTSGPDVGVSYELLHRLEAVDYTNSVLDHEAVERALTRYLDALGQPSRPVRWFDDAASAYAYAFQKAAAREVPWNAVRGAACAVTGGAAEPDPVWVMPWRIARSVASDAAWRAARDAAWSAASHVAERPAWRRLRGGKEWLAWDAVQRDVEGRDEHDRRAIWLPFLEAYEAGLFLLWIAPDEVICVGRPLMRMERAQLLFHGESLHCDTGPAVQWPTGEAYWFWRGVQVPREVIETPDTLTADRIVGEPNVEVRRAMLERVGYERVLERGILIQRDDYGKLWSIEIANDEPLVLVDVEDPSSRRRYLLRVSPSMRTAHAAVAWTFGLEESAYQPTVET